MIIHRFARKAGLAIVTPEDEDDLWCLRRIISEGDFVSSETSRVVKNRGEFTRPDKGERVNVNLTLQVERMKMDGSLGRLRISGKVTDVSEDFLGKGSFHSLIVAADKRIALKKDRWSDAQAKILEGSWRSEEGFTIVAIDRREAGVGRVKGTHLHIYPAVESGFSGKMYVEKTKPDASFYEKVEELLKSTHQPGYKVFITGPGTTKNAFTHFLTAKGKEWGEQASIIDGVDVAGEDGVYTALRSEGLRRAVEKGKLVGVASALEEVIRRISRSDRRVAVGFNEASEAGKMGSVERLIISDRVFEHGLDEAKLIELINQVEELGGRAYLVDSSTDFGSQASSLGGVVALLRYPIPSGEAIS